MKSPHRIKHQRLGVGQATTAPDGRPSQILVRGTWNTDIVPALEPEAGDGIISKHRYSAFFETAFDFVLRDLGIETLIFAGATTSICVESTVRDAMFRDYICIVLEDCTAELIAHDAPRSNHLATLLNIELLFGWVTDSASVLAALQPRKAAE